MNEPINWQSLTPEQRDMLVAEKIMQWQPQACEGSISWDHGIWRCLECGKDGTRHEETTHNIPTPRYTQSMDAAWKALLAAAYHSRHEKVSSLQKLAHELFNCGMIDDLHDLNPYWVLGIIQGWTPEVLCIACLRSCGCEVIT